MSENNYRYSIISPPLIYKWISYTDAQININELCYKIMAGLHMSAVLVTVNNQTTYLKEQKLQW